MFNQGDTVCFRAHSGGNRTGVIQYAKHTRKGSTYSISDNRNGRFVRNVENVWQTTEQYFALRNAGKIKLPDWVRKQRKNAKVEK